MSVYSTKAQQHLRLRTWIEYAFYSSKQAIRHHPQTGRTRPDSSMCQTQIDAKVYSGISASPKLFPIDPWINRCLRPEVYNKQNKSTELVYIYPSDTISDPVTIKSTM